MIFSALNEDGVPLWKLVLSGDKTVTRRLKPKEIGSEFAIQPKRAKKALCVNCYQPYDDHWFDSILTKPPIDSVTCPTVKMKYKPARARVISCIPDEEWIDHHTNYRFYDLEHIEFDKEAKREGFKTWENLVNWIENYYGEGSFSDKEFYRIEFELIR